jgi:SAM-dependent methyltransferase
MSSHIRGWLAHPLTRGLDLDDPATTALRRRIVREKKFLRRIYEEWYEAIAAALPPGGGAVLEIGAGAGFLREYVPGLVASDVLATEGVDLVCDATRLPFAAGSLRAVVMTNVLHHVSDVRGFFREAARCVRAGGRVVMIEPWVTPWSRLVYGKLHHEPFDPAAAEWSFPAAGPLSGANGALPWILFERDREQFRREFPEWRVLPVKPSMPFRYVASGGFTTRDLMPAWTYPAWRGLERLLGPWMRTWATMAEIVLVREGDAGGARDTE